MDNLKIFNAKWTSRSAGPSLDDNKRTEIFLAGCKKACEGNPCADCFNSELWFAENNVAEVTPQEALEQIVKYAPNKYITFVGGEPLDQLEPLARLCTLLKSIGYHIIVITHHMLGEIISWRKQTAAAKELLDSVDVIIDGEYDKSCRIWDENKVGDGLHDVIGSGNQKVYDLRYFRDTGMSDNWAYAGDLEGLYMNINQHLTFVIKDEAWGRYNISMDKKVEASA